MFPPPAAACEVVGHRVMASLDGYGGLLVRRALRIFAEPILNLCTHGFRQASTLNLTGWILRLTGQAHVNTFLRICLRQSLILRDVALDGLPADTYSAGYLPLTQTINAMVMQNLFFLVHVYHVLTNYTITALF